MIFIYLSFHFLTVQNSFLTCLFPLFLWSVQRLDTNWHLKNIRQLKNQRMEKFTLKLYDKLLIAILFSAFILASCITDEPIPAYGIVPMYGAPAGTVSNFTIPQTNPHLLK